jgi:hypothetical protein
MKIGESPDNDLPLPDDPTASHLQALERCSASFAGLGSSTARDRGRTETEDAPPSLTPARDGTVRVVETAPANFNITTRYDHRVDEPLLAERSMSPPLSVPVSLLTGARRRDRAGDRRGPEPGTRSLTR